MPTALRQPSTGRRAARAEPARWRLIRDGARPGARNMALDHALALRAEPGVGVLRLYAWQRPTVSFGRNEPARERFAARAASDAAFDWVRRPTGGRAVLHDRELTYSVVIDSRAFGGPRAAYRRVNRLLASALRGLGAPVGLSEDSDVPAPDAGPCFGAPVAGEIVAADRKLVGSAQARIGGVLLQHGSILLQGDQASLAELGRGVPASSRSASLGELIGDASSEVVGAAVARSMQEGLPGRWEDAEYTASEVLEADRLEAERYREDSWTWRL